MSDKQTFRTRALLTENPEDDLRLHHVFWVYRPSYDAAKAATGLGDIEKHEIDSCLILRGEAQDVTLAEAIVKLAALEQEEISRGGKIEQDAETAADDSWPRSKLGHDFKKSAHHSDYAGMQAAAREQLGRDAATASNDVALLPAIKIKPRGTQP